MHESDLHVTLPGFPDSIRCQWEFGYIAAKSRISSTYGASRLLRAPYQK